MYPGGLAATASDEDINVSFRPTPNYAALAEAAAGSEVGWENTRDENSRTWMKGMRTRTVSEFNEALEFAKSRVLEGGKGMLVEALM